MFGSEYNICINLLFQSGLNRRIFQNNNDTRYEWELLSRKLLVYIKKIYLNELFLLKFTSLIVKNVVEHLLTIQRST